MITASGDRSSANACGAPSSVIISAHFIYIASRLLSLYKFTFDLPLFDALRKPRTGLQKSLFVGHI